MVIFDATAECRGETCRLKITRIGQFFQVRGHDKAHTFSISTNLTGVDSMVTWCFDNLDQQSAEEICDVLAKRHYY